MTSVSIYVNYSPTWFPVHCYQHSVIAMKEYNNQNLHQYSEPILNYLSSLHFLFYLCLHKDQILYSVLCSMPLNLLYSDAAAKRWLPDNFYLQLKKEKLWKNSKIIHFSPANGFTVVSFFFKNIFIDYAITVVPFPPPSLHFILPTPSFPHSPPIVHVHGSYL